MPRWRLLDRSSIRSAMRSRFTFRRDRVVLNVRSAADPQSLSESADQCGQVYGSWVAASRWRFACSPRKSRVSVTDNGIGFVRNRCQHVHHVRAGDSRDRSSRGRPRDRARAGQGIGRFAWGLRLGEGVPAPATAGVRHPPSPRAHSGRFSTVGGFIPPGTGAGRTLRVLVADDNRDAADSLAAILNMSGNEVLVVHSGEERYAWHGSSGRRPSFAISACRG